jgi:hypothetical protein
MCLNTNYIIIGFYTFSLNYKPLKITSLHSIHSFLELLEGVDDGDWKSLAKA